MHGPNKFKSQEVKQKQLKVPQKQDKVYLRAYFYDQVFSGRVSTPLVSFPEGSKPRGDTRIYRIFHVN